VYTSKDYQGKEQKTSKNIPLNSNLLHVIKYPMFAGYERLSLTTDQMVDINGKSDTFEIPFSTDVYATIVMNRKGITSIHQIFSCL